MASPASSEASEIRRRGRQRLIGAIALVLLLVVFVPMVLDSEPRPSRNIPDIPPKENAPALPAPAPGPQAAITPAPVATPASAVTPAPAGAPAANTPATATVTPVEAPATKSDPFAPKSVPPKAPPAAGPAAVAPPKAATPKLEGFAVQVGAFRDETKLKQARDKLAAARIPHYTERLEAQGGPLTRLRAGPFPTREAAEGAQATLKRSALDGKVVPLP